MTKLALAFGSRDARFFSGNMRFASEVPQANIAGTLLARFLAHYRFLPSAVSNNGIHAAVTLADGATTNTTTGFTQPDYPRILTIDGNQAGIAGNVVITGTNFAGDVITDTIALNGTTEVLGVKAFRTVTSVLFPARTQAGDTVSVGQGKLFGLPHIVANASFLLVKLFNASTDAGTLAVDSDELEKNLFSLAGTPDGLKLVDLIYVV